MQKPCRALLIILVLSSLLWAAGAQAVTVDFKKTGEIQVRLELPADFEHVNIALYHIGKVENAAEDLQYTFLDTFRGCDARLDYDTASEADAAARKIDQYIDQHAIQPIARKTTDGCGRVTFDQLQAGVYFGRKAGGESRLDMIPFIITIPFYQNEELLYQVPVNPKFEIKPTPKPSNTPKPGSEEGGKLPQTGVLRWPATALSLLGCAFLLVGLLMIRHDNKNRRKE